MTRRNFLTDTQSSRPGLLYGAIPAVIPGLLTACAVASGAPLGEAGFYVALSSVVTASLAASRTKNVSLLSSTAAGALGIVGLSTLTPSVISVALMGTLSLLAATNAALETDNPKSKQSPAKVFAGAVAGTVLGLAVLFNVATNYAETTTDSTVKVSQAATTAARPQPLLQLA